MATTSNKRARPPESSAIDKPLPSTKVETVTDPTELTGDQKDDFYFHQTQRAHPRGLTSRSLLVSGILEIPRSAVVMFKRLRAAGIIKDDGLVDIHKIDENVRVHLRNVDTTRQGQMIDFLFWWDEECQRLTQLMGEKKDLEAAVIATTAAIKDDPESDDGILLEQFKALLSRVKVKIATNPTERSEEFENDEDEVMRNHLEYIASMDDGGDDNVSGP